MLPNVMAMPLTWLALARLGAVMVPVNTRYTGRELHLLLADSEASHLVIGHDHISVFREMPDSSPNITTRLIIVGPDTAAGLSWEELVDNSPSELPNLPEPALDDLLNIQYTSGTTGLAQGMHADAALLADLRQGLSDVRRARATDASSRPTRSST